MHRQQTGPKINGICKRYKQTTIFPNATFSVRIVHTNGIAHHIFDFYINIYVLHIFVFIVFICNECIRFKLCTAKMAIK